MTASDDPFALAQAAAAAVAERTGVARHDLALVTGSGWVQAADLLTDHLGGATADLAAADLPGFAPARVVGHPARIRSLRAGENTVLAFIGRTHLYEGRGVAAVAHHVRVAAAAGCRAVVLTNGSGGLRANLPPGSIVVLSDHLNLSGATPLSDGTFVDLVGAYSPELRHRVHAAVPDLPEGVYAQLHGPQFETPAEIRMLATLGADLVGMSTAVETIAARHVGLEVLGLSLVTNMAAGITGAHLSAEEVTQAGIDSAGRVADVLERVLRVV